MTALLTRLRTARALGVTNIAQVLSYRLRLRAGVHPAQRLPRVPLSPGPFFAPALTRQALPAPSAWRNEASYFGWLRPALGDGPPDWHTNPFTGQRAAQAADDWWTIRDFDPATGDIKTIWEASRFDWVVSFAQRGEIDRLNAWLADWAAKNPPYLGHNWKCAQEASIRVMHLALAALILGQIDAPQPALADLLVMHLSRIGPTIAYARAQENNHGTSEAAALLVGGSWLAKLGRSEGSRWAELGRRLLEDRARLLIAPDGSFSQHSVNYHRLMLDTLSLAEVWRRALALAGFSAEFRARASAATEWLRALVDPGTGDAPNLGGNDSANLLPLTDADSRDFRPSVQLAAALFTERRAYDGVAHCDTHLAWLGVAMPEQPAPAPPEMFDDGGLAILRAGTSAALLRFPRFRFRPAHADILHVDLRVGGENALRDGGSYSYAADMGTQELFGGVRGHNTIQFDDHEQMRRLGRFLWAEWPRTRTLSPVARTGAAVEAAAAYRDAWGAEHAREVRLSADELAVTDRVGGFATRAVLRWRLRPGAWRLDGSTATNGAARLAVSADVPIVRCAIVEGWESRRYLQKSALPVLEVEIAKPGTITSRYRHAA